MDTVTLAASSDHLIQLLLAAKFAEGEISIGISVQFDITTADLNWDEYNINQMLSLRYHTDGHFDLHYSYYNDDSEGYLTFFHDLSPEQTAALPQGLSDVMKRVLSDRRPIVITPKSIYQTGDK